MTQDDFALSVVLPVYAAVAPAHLDRALRSVHHQTYQPNEVVIVQDGPLPDALREVIREHVDAATIPHNHVVLDSNRGAGPANDAGLKAARCAWIAKMDADDIALPSRFEVQVRALASGGYDLVGSSVMEFAGCEENVLGARIMPQDSDAIRRHLLFNNPVNHPTAIYRRDLALAVGGYRTLPFLEDYDFVARMLAAGARMYNVPQPLLLFRGGPASLLRRRSKSILAAEFRLQRNLIEYGLSNRWLMARNLFIRSTFRLLPPWLMRRAYGRLFLHKNKQ